MDRRQRARCQDQASIRRAREGRDGALDLGRVAHVNRAHVHANRRRHRLDNGELADPRCDGGVPKDRCSCHVRRDLLEQFQPFCTQTVFEHQKASGVAARPRQTIDEAGTDRIGDDRKYDRHSASCLEHRPQTCGATRHDDVGRKRDQFRRVFANVGGIACGPAGVDAHVAALGPAQLLQPLEKGGVAGLFFRIAFSERHQHADALQVGLLPAPRERPCSSRTGEKRDELATSHDLPQA